MKNEINEMNYKLNFLKGIACMGVVFIHITFPGMFGQIMKYVSAYAVPIFFMTAGYYAFGSGATIIKRRLFKTIKYFLYGYILFFIFRFLSVMKNHNMDIWLSENFNRKTIIKYICFCTIDFAVPLWYLIAMIELYIIWYFIVKKQKEENVLKFIPILFILQVVLISYCDTLQLEWFWKTNVITRAFPWFLFGYYIRKNEIQKFKNIHRYKLLGMIIIGCLIVLIPVVFHISIQFSALGYIPYASGLFLLTLKHPNIHICRIVEYIGEKLSLNIYIFHALVAGVLDVIFDLVFKANVGENIWLWCRPIITLIFTIVASLVVYYIIKNQCKFRERKRQLSDF